MKLANLIVAGYQGLDRSTLVSPR